MNRRARRDEEGFTVIEVVIAMMLLSLVMALIFSSLWQTQRSEAYSRGRTEALDDMRQTMNRMTKDLRQVSSISGTPTASSLDVMTYVDGTLTRVVYQVTGDELTRQVGAGTATTMQVDLTTPDLFTYTPDATAPNILTIVLSVRPANLPETTLILESEVEFRNG